MLLTFSVSLSHFSETSRETSVLSPLFRNRSQGTNKTCTRKRVANHIITIGLAPVDNYKPIVLVNYTNFGSVAWSVIYITALVRETLSRVYVVSRQWWKPTTSLDRFLIGFRDAITYLASTVTNIVNISTSYGIDYIYTYSKLVDYTRDDNGNQSTVVGYSAICYNG